VLQLAAQAPGARYPYAIKAVNLRRGFTT
jgi:hypothetical protein